MHAINAEHVVQAAPEGRSSRPPARQQEQQQRLALQHPPQLCWAANQSSPVEAVADGGPRAHELEQQQQRLGGHAKGARVDEAEQRVCRQGKRKGMKQLRGRLDGAVDAGGHSKGAGMHEAEQRVCEAGNVHRAG